MILNLEKFTIVTSFGLHSYSDRIGEKGIGNVSWKEIFEFQPKLIDNKKFVLNFVKFYPFF